MEDTTTIRNREQGTFDEARAKDAGTPPWDVFGRPDKPVAEYTAEESQAEAVNLARVYLARRRFEVGPELWPAPMSGRSYLVATDERGCAVVVRVRGRVRAGAGALGPQARPAPLAHGERRRGGGPGRRRRRGHSRPAPGAPAAPRGRRRLGRGLRASQGEGPRATGGLFSCVSVVWESWGVGPRSRPGHGARSPPSPAPCAPSYGGVRHP